MPTRRELLKQLTLATGLVLSPGAASFFLSGCTLDPEKQAQTGRWLDETAFARLSALCDRILPPTDTPGASDVGAPQLIDFLLQTVYAQPEQAVVQKGLEQLGQQSQGLFGLDFPALTAPQQDQLLESWVAEMEARPPAAPLPHPFALLRELTVLAYFTAEPVVTEQIGYAPVPGMWKGCVPLTEYPQVWAE